MSPAAIAYRDYRQASCLTRHVSPAAIAYRDYRQASCLTWPYLIVVVLFGLLVQGVYAAKPNIIVIYADDMGYGDCTVNNPESKIPTPNIDRLANEGLRFTDAHSPSSTCTASRFGLLTGTCPVRRGVVNGLTGLGPVIDKDEVTIADFLKDQEYVTRMIGKWHLGFEMYGDGPSGRTFDFSKPLARWAAGLRIRFLTSA